MVTQPLCLALHPSSDGLLPLSLCQIYILFLRSLLVTTSKAPVTTSKAPVTTSFLFVSGGRGGHCPFPLQDMVKLAQLDAVLLCAAVERGSPSSLERFGLWAKNRVIK